MKIKYFYTDSRIDKLQNEINEWINENRKIFKIIDIKYATVERHGSILFSSIVIYKNKHIFSLKLKIKKLLKTGTKKSKESK